MSSSTTWAATAAYAIVFPELNLEARRGDHRRCQPRARKPWRTMRCTWTIASVAPRARPTVPGNNKTECDPSYAINGGSERCSSARWRTSRSSPNRHRAPRPGRAPCYRCWCAAAPQSLNTRLAGREGRVIPAFSFMPQSGQGVPPLETQGRPRISLLPRGSSRLEAGPALGKGGAPQKSSPWGNDNVFHCLGVGFFTLRSGARTMPFKKTPPRRVTKHQKRNYTSNGAAQQFLKT